MWSHSSSSVWVNSFALGRFYWKFRWVMFKLNLMSDGWGISGEIALRWLSLDLPDDTSALVQVMACCRQATSHYLSQCWPSSVSPYDVTWGIQVHWPAASVVNELCSCTIKKYPDPTGRRNYVIEMSGHMLSTLCGCAYCVVNFP